MGDTASGVPAPAPRPRLELWKAGYQVHDLAGAARRPHAEAEGWDGQMAMDSQSLSADPYVVLAELATRTTRLLLGTSVTNPGTRHPAVTANAMVSLQALSGGRAVLGIGRGDSAMAFLGRAPLPVDAFERCLLAIQAYLRGEEVPFDALDGSGPSAAHPDLSSLELGRAPEAVRIRWIPADLPKVPLDVAATGPRVIAAAARTAERVTVGVGAAPERVAWAVETARAARAAAGLDPAGISMGAQLIVIPHPDRAEAVRLATDLAAPLARFSTLDGRVVGPTSPAEHEVFERLRARYDMTRHGDVGAASGTLPPEFVERFAVVGPPDDCVARLAELVDAGLERMVVCGPTGFVDPVAERRSRELLVREVLPGLRAAVGA
jgi:5,10-methylenetetrahydromethanopterin reductase